MLNIIPLLLLVFGWIYEVKGLVISSLCISAFFMICCIVSIHDKHEAEDIGVFLLVVIFTMSIIKLVI